MFEKTKITRRIISVLLFPQQYGTICHSERAQVTEESLVRYRLIREHSLICGNIKRDVGDAVPYTLTLRMTKDCLGRQLNHIYAKAIFNINKYEKTKKANTVRPYGFSVAYTQKQEGADTLPLSFCDENYFSSSILPCSFSNSFIRFLTIIFN